MTASPGDARSAALDAYIAERGEHGFKVETRSGRQAVLVRRHPVYSRMRWLAGDRAEQRVVVSVDQHGRIATRNAQPVRW